MRRNRLKLVSEAPAGEADDLSFPPPFGEQAKYLKLADEFLARTSVEQEQSGKIISIGAGRRAKNRRSERAA